MKIMFEGKGFDEQIINCPHCGWQGKGSDAHIIDLYGITKSSEVHCPKCDGYLGGIKSSDLPGSNTGVDPLGTQF